MNLVDKIMKLTGKTYNNNNNNNKSNESVHVHDILFGYSRKVFSHLCLHRMMDADMSGRGWTLLRIHRFREVKYQIYMFDWLSNLHGRRNVQIDQ